MNNHLKAGRHKIPLCMTVILTALLVLAVLALVGCVRSSQIMVNPKTGQQVMVETYPGNMSLGSAVQAAVVQKQRIEYLEKHGYVKAEEAGFSPAPADPLNLKELTDKE